jgi:hypothetical protein
MEACATNNKQCCGCTAATTESDDAPSRIRTAVDEKIPEEDDAMMLE